MNAPVSGNPIISEEFWDDEFKGMVEDRNAPLHPDLLPYVEEQGEWGPMLRSPLVYQVPLMLPGAANKMLAYKRERIIKHSEAGDWSTVIFLHERPYRLDALIEYVTGRYEDGTPGPADCVPEHWDLIADVWVDSENIEQKIDDWRALFNDGEGLWLGTAEERAAFDALPDPIPAWRGGTVGDWSWTTERKTAAFFAGRSGYPVRSALIPKSDCFGYLTRRGEFELLVRLTEERRPLVYPNGEV